MKPLLYLSYVETENMTRAMCFTAGGSPSSFYEGGSSSLVAGHGRKMVCDSTLGLSFFLGFTEPLCPEILTILLFSDDRLDKLLEGYRVSLPKFISVLPSTQRAKRIKKDIEGMGRTRNWNLKIEPFFPCFFQ